MEIDTVINGILLLVTAITALCAFKQYLEEKDSKEQAREICIYLVCLYDTQNNLWAPLKIALQGSNKKTKSMYYAVIVENNSNQPIRDLVVNVNQRVFENYQIKNMKISNSIGDIKQGQSPIKMLPPGKWIISIDETPSEDEVKVISQGMNLLEDLINFENAAYVPIVRTKEDGINSYSFIDHMGKTWSFSSKNGCKLKKMRGH